MKELNLTEPSRSNPPAPASPVPVAPQDRKNPGVAFLLSLLLPGLGQLYCGKTRRGLITMLFSLIFGTALAFLPFYEGEAGILMGFGLRMVLVLYLFSFLDAYFTAREINLGLDSVLPFNPRVAAVLNLLTRGFGYWYVDEKKKGTVLFLIVGIAGRASLKMEDPAGIWLSLVVELALAVMAADAYRIARHENALAVTAPPVRREGIEPEEGLKPAIPLALASLFVFAYVGLIVLAAVLPDYEKVDQSQAVVSATPNGKVYVNPKYGVQLFIPVGWELDHTSDPNVLVEAEATAGGCALSLAADTALPFVTVESIGQNLIEELKLNNPGLEVRDRKASQLAGAAAYEVVVRRDFGGIALDETLVVARRRLSTFLLIVSAAGPPDDPCRTQITRIRDRLILPN